MKMRKEKYFIPVLLSIFDLATTKIGLLKGAEEANPLLATILNNYGFGILAFIILTALYLTCLGLWYVYEIKKPAFSEWGKTIIISMSSIISFVILQNIFIILKIR
jgi:hypothetical protein